MRRDDGLYVSIYCGELTPECFTNNIKRIATAFPDLDESFYEILAERVKSLGFSNERLTNAVSKVIDECVYPRPTIAQFVSHNKIERLYTYQEMQCKVSDSYGSDIFKYFQKINIDGIVYWHRKHEKL